MPLEPRNEQYLCPIMILSRDKFSINSMIWWWVEVMCICWFVKVEFGTEDNILCSGWLCPVYRALHVNRVMWFVDCLGSVVDGSSSYRLCSSRSIRKSPGGHFHHYLPSWWVSSLAPPPNTYDQPWWLRYYLENLSNRICKNWALMVRKLPHTLHYFLPNHFS